MPKKRLSIFSQEKSQKKDPSDSKQGAPRFSGTKRKVQALDNDKSGIHTPNKKHEVGSASRDAVGNPYEAEHSRQKVELEKMGDNSHAHRSGGKNIGEAGQIAVLLPAVKPDS